MNGTDHHEPAAEALQEFTGLTFHGRWRALLPIVVTNLLLSIVTLGIYRFWAKARVRRYLWSETQFVDDRLEWTGTGKEMFLGFLMVMAVLIPVALFAQFGLQVLALRGYEVLAGFLFIGLYAGFFYLIGVARFRALRYRLSRTRWHGIRGGSDTGGWGYGVQAIICSLAVTLTAGLLQPWAMVTLWRARFGAMSFGDAPIGVGYGALPKGIFARWIMIYVAFIAIIAILVGAFASTLVADPDSAARAGMVIIGAVAAIYLLLPILFVTYYTKFIRGVIGEMDWMNLQFDFTARTSDWVKLYLGHAGLIVITLGFGLLFIGYRNWSFFVRHLQVRGTLDIDLIRQSETRMRTDAEGLADAFDIGGI
ncbi:YjgN family protein [Pacificimonas sp. ICDLI1SI03]